MFDMGWLGWIISILGTLGFVGTIALAFLAPQFLLVIWKMALALIGRILSTRIGCAALAFLVAAVVFEMHGDHEGAARIQGEWDAAKVEYQAELARLNQRADEHARERNQQARTAEQAEDRERGDRLAAYTAALPRPGDSCGPLTDRDIAAARGLQNERGRRDRKAVDRHP